MSATKVIPPNRDAERIIRCAATLMRAAHTVEELTADQRDGWLTIGADARDSCDALRAEVAVQRELLERVGAAHAALDAFTSESFGFPPHLSALAERDAVLDAIRAHLAGAAVPAAEGHVFGVGDVVRVVGNSEGNPSGEHDFAIGSEAVVRGRPDGRLIAVRGVDRPTLFQDVLVHDLVLVRKAGA
jgi:hypothetical protein